MLSGKRSDLQQFKDWLQCHKEEFKDVSPTDIARQAIVEGFSIIIVRQWEAQERYNQIRNAS